MLEYCSLNSGSSGNSFYIKSNNTNILVDAGISLKKINEALITMNKKITDIDAILVTHEHIDHIKSIGMISLKYNIPVYANLKTWTSMQNEKKKLSEDCIRFFKNENDFYIGDLKIFPFSIPHDAADPCGFNIFYEEEKLSIATDLGHITPELIRYFDNSTSIILEANYDQEILKFSSYPYILKRRILGPNGHLDNNATANTICKLIPSGLKNALLVHLSKENNFPELVHKTVEEQLIKEFSSLPVIDINVAPRYFASPLLKVI